MPFPARLRPYRALAHSGLIDQIALDQLIGKAASDQFKLISQSRD